MQVPAWWGMVMARYWQSLARIRTAQEVDQVVGEATHSAPYCQLRCTLLAGQ